jgi:hypothetical protein
VAVATGPVSITSSDSRRGRSSSSERVLVTCPECTLPREISVRQLRRIESGESDGRCKPCQHPTPRELPDASDYRYWLTWAGAELNGNDPLAWVSRHGLPGALAEIVNGLWPAKR